MIRTSIIWADHGLGSLWVCWLWVGLDIDWAGHVPGLPLFRLGVGWNGHGLGRALADLAMAWDGNGLAGHGLIWP